MRRPKRFSERDFAKADRRKNNTAAGYDSGLRSRAIVIGADVFFDYANHYLIRGAEINIQTATETANATSLPSALFHRFLSDLTLNFTDLKPLDSIGFTGMHFLKNAPTIAFYFFGGYFLACGIIAPQIAELRIFISSVNRPKAPPPSSVRRA